MLASGCDVINAGMVPTPLLYFAAKTLAASSSGVMLTGSHNPAEYNGLKIMIAGESLAEEKIQALYKRILQQRFSEGRGKETKIDITTLYFAEVQQIIFI